MKITVGQLRRLIREQAAEEALAAPLATPRSAGTKKVYPEDVQVGKTYTLGYRNNRWSSNFLAWESDPQTGAPVMTWMDAEHPDGWQAYMFRGVMVVGTSADQLLIFE